MGNFGKVVEKARELGAKANSVRTKAKEAVSSVAKRAANSQLGKRVNNSKVAEAGRKARGGYKLGKNFGMNTRTTKFIRPEDKSRAGNIGNDLGRLAGTKGMRAVSKVANSKYTKVAAVAGGVGYMASRKRRK